MLDYTDIRNIVGIENVNFEKDGKEIRGARLYTLEDIPAGRGTGKKSDKIFLSEAKLKQMSFTPAVGQTVAVYYNRYGGVNHIGLTDDLTVMAYTVSTNPHRFSKLLFLRYRSSRWSCRSSRSSLPLWIVPANRQASNCSPCASCQGR